MMHFEGPTTEVAEDISGAYWRCEGRSEGTDIRCDGAQRRRIVEQKGIQPMERPRADNIIFLKMYMSQLLKLTFTRSNHKP